MNVFDDFAERIGKVIHNVTGPETAVDRVVVEPPRDAAHGDLASNAAMVLAKPLGVKPRELAMRIAASLATDPDVETAEVAGPGFINLRLRPNYWQKVLKSAIAAGAAFGRRPANTAAPANVEYVSANPTGPMHVGHCRGAVFGDALANLLEAAGTPVTREYYINDAGAQVDVLARSAFLRYREALGQDVGAIPEGLYPGDYLVPVGKALADRFGDTLLGQDEAAWLPTVRDVTMGMMLEMIRGDLAALGITHEVFFSERSLIDGPKDRVAEAIDWLAGKGLVYTGRLPPPKGHAHGSAATDVDDWDDREQLLFSSTQFGDDVDRPLKKADGSYTYFATDIAYHFDKYQRGFRNLIDVWGADHAGYVRRVNAAVQAMSDGEAALDVKIIQLVRLFRGGEPVKMSKRSGTFVTLRDVVDEVGPDPIRFMMVYRRNDAPLDFDFERVLEQSKDNPVFYVQYAHARTCSVFRQAAAELPDMDVGEKALARADLSLLSDSGELALVRRLAEYPRQIATAAEAHEPHRIAFYLYELASEFHGQWNRGKELPQLRFINHAAPDSTLARLALVQATKLVLSSGLDILGVTAPEEMR